jgi:hypothetical protein
MRRRQAIEREQLHAVDETWKKEFSIPQKTITAEWIPLDWK